MNQLIYRWRNRFAPLKMGNLSDMKIFIKTSLAIMVAVLCFSRLAFADDEVCGACDKKVLVSGQYDHGFSATPS